MNKQQRDYKKAAQEKQLVEMRIHALEKVFLKGSGLMSEDGTEADRLYKIEDDDLFDRACKEFETLEGVAELNEEYSRTSKALRIAEDALIEYGLSIVPVSIARTLRDGIRNNYTIRQKLITTTLKLNTATVKTKQ